MRAPAFLLNARLALAVELVERDRRARLGRREHLDGDVHQADLEVPLPGCSCCHAGHLIGASSSSLLATCSSLLAARYLLLATGGSLPTGGSQLAASYWLLATSSLRLASGWKRQRAATSSEQPAASSEKQAARSELPVICRPARRDRRGPGR